MNSSIIFTKLWVIESLPDGELKTGKNLVDNQLEDAKIAQQNLKVNFKQPVTKSEFFEVLEKIKDESLNGEFPMIHIECHGCEDGLGVASGELIEWDELREHFIDINKSCQLNLMIVVAACNGANLIKVSTKLDAAPFWAIIGPESEVTAGNIQVNFGNFYKIFFKDLDGDKAIKALNLGKSGSDRKYHFLSAEGLFSRAYLKYYKSHCIGKGKSERIESLTSQAMQNPEVKNRGVNWARIQIKNGLRDEDKHFEKLKKRFFFIDKYPNNANRFKISREDIVDEKQP